MTIKKKLFWFEISIKSSPLTAIKNIYTYAYVNMDELYKLYEIDLDVACICLKSSKEH